MGFSPGRRGLRRGARVVAEPSVWHLRLVGPWMNLSTPP